MEDCVHWTWMLRVPAKVNRGIISRTGKKVVKSKVELSLPFMMYLFQMIYLRGTSVI